MESKNGFSSIDVIMTFFLIVLFVLFCYSNIKDRVNDSNKSKYLDKVLRYIENVKMNISDYPVEKDGSTYYIPVICISSEENSNWSNAYVVVVYDKKYEFYWTSLDVNGNYIPLTKEEELEIDVIEEKSAKGITKKGIISNNFYTLNNSCQLVK